jgi:hypothetical protein
MSPLTLHAPDTDRVRANTWADVNEAIDRRTQLRLRSAAARAADDELSARIARLEYEWNFDRVVETEASLMGLLGLALAAAAGDRRLLVLPGTVSVMVLVHSLYGWYPLLPLFRRLGIRTQDEIDRERYALKAVRGDFESIPPSGTPAAERAAAAWQAVWK